MTTKNTTKAEINLNLLHLQAELARLDVYIRREVWRWQLAGQDPTDIYRGLYLSDEDALLLLERPLGSSWGQTVALEPLEREAFTEAENRAKAEAEQLVETARQKKRMLRWVHLVDAFELDRFEQDTLLICLAPCLDLRYEQLYGYLQDNLNRRQPSVNLILNLLCQPGPERLLTLPYFAAESPLRRYHLLQSTPDPSPLAQVLTPDPTLIAWLLGDYRPRPELRHALGPIRPEISPTDQLLAEAYLPRLKQAITAQALLAFDGPDRLRQEAAARLLAAEIARPLLRLDLAALNDETLSPLEALHLTLRDARLTGAVPCLFGWDSCLTSDGTAPTAWLSALCDHPGPVIVAGTQPWQPGDLDRRRPLHRLEFPVPDYSQRLKLWEHYLADLSETDDRQPATEYPPPISNLPSPISQSPISTLTGQFALTSGQIRDVIASARDAASERGGEVSNEDLFTAARNHSNPRLAALARKLTPRYTWADIVLPPDQQAMLREIVDTVRGRALVLEQWGVGRKLASSAAVTVLFAGDPGTGKTMAAEVMASELKLDLYKIDLSTVVSKYIGETEKNLEKIFSEAESSNAILFFDEADAIFGKRSEVKDAHDRYANIEVSYLLQRMEAYNGITILATNLRANLDEAFTRRLHFLVDFPFPEPADRLRIWQTLFPPDVPCAPDLDFATLAERHKLAGGNIRNIIVAAAYHAAANGGRVTMAHLQHGTRRELQKMGRMVSQGLTGD